MMRHANPLAPRPSLIEKTRQIKSWVREALELDEKVVVSVTELACRDAGCPDIETVIGIMRPGAKIKTLRIHKAIAEIVRQDIATA
jgi:hypothetical protein